MEAAVGRAIDERLVLGRGRTGAASCGACRTGLDLPMRAAARALTVEPDGSDPFTVLVELPLVRCGECAIENVPPELVTDLHAVVRMVCDADDRPTRWRGPFSRLRRRGGRGSRGLPSRP